MTHQLTFDAISEAKPGPKWRARWDRSWPAYRAWFTARGGERGPDRAACEDALAQHMPELVPIHAALVREAGGDDLAARFLSTWCPPAYLGGCSLAAFSRDGETRLLRNYDLSPELNEGLLLRSEWGDRPVMGMVEFLWGVSDGINADGLSVALAFGGTATTGEGFGICTILRYVLETCADVPAALDVLSRVPSHMDYNVVLTDADGGTASIELHAGGGSTLRDLAIATNHQLDAPLPDRASFTRTVERHAALARLVHGRADRSACLDGFRSTPLVQSDYAGGFGTLFTAEYIPIARAMRLVWDETEMAQSLDTFEERSVTIRYGSPAPDSAGSLADIVAGVPEGRKADAARWVAEAEAGRPDWVALGALFAPLLETTH